MKGIHLGGAYTHLAVLVDDEDYDWLIGYSWCRNPGGKTDYAVARVDGRVQQMHRLILRPPPGLKVDHRNGNGLDNRRSNLRLATARQNQQNQSLNSRNTSGFKGVSLVRGKRLDRPYHAYIQHEGRTRSLGHFATGDAAARAYDRAARELFGEFAFLNFPLEHR